VPPVDLTGDRVIAYWLGQNQPIAFTLQEITPEGAILESQILWEIGEEIPLELWFPGEVRQRGRGRVVGAAVEPCCGMRIKFIELSPGAQTALGRYLARRGRAPES
jgi:hypothetical protein